VQAQLDQWCKDRFHTEITEVVGPDGDNDLTSIDGVLGEPGAETADLFGRSRTGEDLLQLIDHHDGVTLRRRQRARQ